MFYNLYAQGGGRVGLAGAADQHDIVGTIHEVAAMQLPDQGLVHLAGGEVAPERRVRAPYPSGLNRLQWLRRERS